MTDLDIAQAATMKPIAEIAAKLGVREDEFEPYGRTKAKISLGVFDRLPEQTEGKLVLVTAITPTPAGEGKTTTTIGLSDALNRLGRNAIVCLREPSLGPCFGMKGGAAGGGYAQVVPMEEINLHFTGDFHAITSAHNLLSAMIDNHLHHGNALGIDPRRISWKRVLDMNDRALRNVVVGLGGPTNSVPRESGFDITVASEVMAIFCLSRSLDELQQRLERIVIGQTYDRKPVTAGQIGASGAMAALLRDALKPNLVQTLEHNPALVHGGPFANIAHGCNSVIATKLAMRLGDITVTEAGFGADLGAEKFFDIKCRHAGLSPDAVVLVATVRALKLHGGVEVKDLSTPDAAAVKRGLPNLDKHIENIAQFGVPVVVAINAFLADTDDEFKVIEESCAAKGVTVVRAEHWEHGGAGAEALGEAVINLLDNAAADFKPLYPDDMSLWEKIRTIAQRVYGADDITAPDNVRKKLDVLQDEGYGMLPVCMAKTQYSFSTDPTLRGRPTGFDIPIRDVKVSAGAGFVVVLTGDVMTMPGLPRTPAAQAIRLDEQGRIIGLF
jgi:formate--tetrahydrofolate ligase